MSSFIHALSLGIFTILLLTAAVSDLRRFIIPNWLVIALLVLYPAYVLSAPTPILWFQSLAVFSAALLLGVIAFRFGIMGAGDGKLLAAVLLWSGPVYALNVLAVTAISGGVLALLFGTGLKFGLALALDKRGDNTLQNSLLANKLPYGIAIAIGGMAFLIETI